MIESILKWLVGKVPITQELAIFLLEAIVNSSENKADAKLLVDVINVLRNK